MTCTCVTFYCCPFRRAHLANETLESVFDLDIREKSWTMRNPMSRLRSAFTYSMR
jgi:hypothetical protein